MTIKIIFAGTPEFAAVHLQALIDSQYQVIGVYTKPDAVAGRGHKRQASPVKQLAVAHQLPVFQPKSLKTIPAQQQLAELEADLMVVVAYGLMLPQAVLDAPRLGCINVHGSLLPRWRGAAPFQRAIWAGDQQSGVTIMQMDIGLDTGDMLLVEKCHIDPDETSGSLYEKIAKTAPQTLLKAVNQLAMGELIPIQQDEQHACYAAKLSKQEALLDWQLSAEQLERCVRAFNPWPMSYLLLADQGSLRQVKVWQAHVSDLHSHEPLGTVVAANKQGISIVANGGVLTITRLQPPGKKPMSPHEFLNGRAAWCPIGTQLPRQVSE